MYSIRVKRDPTSDDELANKKFVDTLKGDCNILSFNQTLQNYLKASLGNDVYSPAKNDKIQITAKTVFKNTNTGRFNYIDGIKNVTTKITKKRHTESADPAKALGPSNIVDCNTVVEL